MKITIENTTKIVDLNGTPARVWEGRTESGARCHLYVTRIACDATDTATCDQFARELQEQRAPSAEVAAIPTRLVL